MTTLFFRASTAIAIALAVWAIFPIDRNRGTVRRVAVAFFAVVCWRSARQLLLLSSLPVGSPDREGVRWECLKGIVPPGTVVGYAGPVPRDEIAVDYGFRPVGRSKRSLDGLLALVSAEAALAPAVVVNRPDAEFVVMDVGPGAPATPGPRYEPVTRCSSGTALFRRKRS